MNTQTAAEMTAKLAEDFRKAYDIYCNARPGKKTEAARARMERITLTAEKRGLGAELTKALAY